MIISATGTQMLPRIVGVSKAKRMILMAEKLSAEEGLECGLVDFLAQDYVSLEAEAIKCIDKIKTNVL